MQFSDIFSSGMVFAKGQPIRVYGTGEGSAEITFANITRKVTSQDGQWYTEFSAMDYGGPYALIFKAWLAEQAAAGNTITEADGTPMTVPAGGK